MAAFCAVCGAYWLCEHSDEHAELIDVDDYTIADLSHQYQMRQDVVLHTLRRQWIREFFDGPGANLDSDDPQLIPLPAMGSR